MSALNDLRTIQYYIKMGIDDCSSDCVRELNDSIESLAETIDKSANTEVLVAALKALIPIVRQNLEDQGGCDHSVGICACPEIRALEQAEAALKKIG